MIIDCNIEHLKLQVSILDANGYYIEDIRLQFITENIVGQKERTMRITYNTPKK